MPLLTPVLTEQEIAEKVQILAERIALDYSGREIILIGILKGAFIFLADLVRKLEIPHKIDFMRVASYTEGTVSSGHLSMTKDLETDISGRDVLIVEDIVDSGLTMAFLLEHLKKQKPKSIAICTLIDKTERREQPVDVKYVCHRVKSGFLVGYGLDCNEEYRGLSGIYELL